MRALIKSGMDIARFNFSHGSHEEHKGRMDQLKELREQEKKPIAILLDTKGPEIRTGHAERWIKGYAGRRQCIYTEHQREKVR